MRAARINSRGLRTELSIEVKSCMNFNPFQSEPWKNSGAFEGFIAWNEAVLRSVRRPRAFL
jgi:hypothetical protein